MSAVAEAYGLDPSSRVVLGALPAAIYTTDAEGRITFYNEAAARLWGREPELNQDRWCAAARLIAPDGKVVAPQDSPVAATLKTGTVIRAEAILERPDGSRVEIVAHCTPLFDAHAHLQGSVIMLIDITDKKNAERGEKALEQQSYRLFTLNQVAKTLSQDLDQERIVQAVTDIATELSGAKFGAFFYNINDPSGAALQLYTLSGAARAAFEKLGRPRATPVFHPTMVEGRSFRSGDIRKDPRYGAMAPHHGMPHGHLPVVSYLAVPVTSRQCEVIGALLFAHDQPDMFSQETEDLMLGVAGHAAIAVDNARLHQAAQFEVEQRKKAEESKDLLLHEIKHRVKNTLGTVQAIASQTFRAAPRAERDAFGARLRAMSEAHDLLTNQDWGTAAVTDIVSRAVAPFNPGRFSMRGDDAELPPAKALLLAMAVHELATNAVKYGALSNGEGRIAIDWHGDKHRLVFHWRESGGPAVSPPTHRGFGSNLIQRAMAGEQGGAQFDYAPDGLRCSLEIAN